MTYNISYIYTYIYIYVLCNISNVTDNIKYKRYNNQYRIHNLNYIMSNV